jgi:hypothetical protein
MRPRTIEEIEKQLHLSTDYLVSESLHTAVTEIVSLAKYYRDGERHNGKAFQTMKKEMYFWKAQFESTNRKLIHPENQGEVTNSCQ